MGVQKPRKDANPSQALKYPMLEEQLVQLFVGAMEETELRPSTVTIRKTGHLNTGHS